LKKYIYRPRVGSTNGCGAGSHRHIGHPVPEHVSHRSPGAGGCGGHTQAPWQSLAAHVEQKSGI